MQQAFPVVELWQEPCLQIECSFYTVIINVVTINNVIAHLLNLRLINCSFLWLWHAPVAKTHWQHLLQKYLLKEHFLHGARMLLQETDMSTNAEGICCLSVASPFIAAGCHKLLGIMLIFSICTQQI